MDQEQRLAVAVDIGGTPVVLRTRDQSFREVLERRYSGFTRPALDAPYTFDIDLFDPTNLGTDQEIQVSVQSGRWTIERGDFRAEWDSRTAMGRIRQAPNQYAIDSVLRIVHTLILAREGGFLMHAASAIRNGSAFIFAGVSGAGKTTISRLAPPDATLLTDEISYVRRTGQDYVACGTPFAGELGKAGENTAASVRALFFLKKGAENRIVPMRPPEAVERVLRNILFFAEDGELVRMVFQSACDFVRRVPVHELIFQPDARVWDLIR